MSPLVPAFAVSLALGAIGCGEGEDDEGGSLESVGTDVCASGKRWSGATSGSPLMLPGEDCIGCHASGEGPSYTIAGTVYSELAQTNGCAGVSSVEVEITDATGKVITLSTNAAGNFATGQAVTMPIGARLRQAGKVRAMAASVNAGSCNTCHTADGTSSAPGRILAP